MFKSYQDVDDLPISSFVFHRPLCDPLCKTSYLLVSVNKITWLSKEALDNVHPTAIELKNLLVHDWSVNQTKFKIWIIKFCMLLFYHNSLLCYNFYIAIFCAPFCSQVHMVVLSTVNIFVIILQSVLFSFCTHMCYNLFHCCLISLYTVVLPLWTIICHL